MIIDLVDEKDDRPLWVMVWGGANTLAQAIWTVRQERSETEVRKFLNKLCVYTITDQDVCGGPPVDPDKDKLTFHWWILPEAGTYTSTVSIREADKANAILRIPQDAAGKELHIICEVTDNGTPALTSYRRVIIRPKR